MKCFKSSADSSPKTGCSGNRTVKGWRSNRGYMFAMMLAMLALMAVMGVGLSRLMMTTKATTQMQRSQDNKQLMNSLVMTLSSKAADSDGDFVLEPPAYSTETITGFTAPTNGGFVGTDVVNVDAWGRRLGYCAYDYGSATATAPSGKGLIRGSTASTPTDSWVALVVISAGPDGVLNSPCPAAGTAASDVAATGDDMVAARSYGEMVSFGNAQIASSLSGMGTNSTNKLCRLGSDGKMKCDISTGISNSNTAYRMCRSNEAGSIVCDIPSVLPTYLGASTMEPSRLCGTNAWGYMHCYTFAATCGAGQVSKWNGSDFECVTSTSVSIYRASANGWTCGHSVPNDKKAMVTEPGDSFPHRPSIARCAEGYRVTGGGYHMVHWGGSDDNSANSPDSSFPSSDSEFRVVAGGHPSNACFQAYAVCAK